MPSPQGRIKVRNGGEGGRRKGVIKKAGGWMVDEHRWMAEWTDRLTDEWGGWMNRWRLDRWWMERWVAGERRDG